MNAPTFDWTSILPATLFAAVLAVSVLYAILRRHESADAGASYDVFHRPMDCYTGPWQ